MIFCGTDHESRSGLLHHALAGAGFTQRRQACALYHNKFPFLHIARGRGQPSRFQHLFQLFRLHHTPVIAADTAAFPDQIQYFHEKIPLSFAIFNGAHMSVRPYKTDFLYFS